MIPSFALLCVSGFVQFVAAKDVYLQWDVTWVHAAPDGYGRPVIGINDKWPCPQVDVNVGDQLIVDVTNNLGNQSTGIHWHGLHQYGAGTMDGASSVSQCPVPPGSTIRYNLTVSLKPMSSLDTLLIYDLQPRWTKLVHIGIIHTTWGSIPMACAAH